MDTKTNQTPENGQPGSLALNAGSAFYDNLPNPPLSIRAIETAALIETRSGDEGELYRRWVAMQIDEARRDAFIDCESEMEKLRNELREIAAELTAVVQQNIAEGIPPALAINHRLNSVLRVLSPNT